MTTVRKKNNVFKFVNKIIIMMSIFFLVFPSTINALDNNIDAFSTNEFFESTDFNLTLNGVNMKSVFIGQNALVYFSISTQVEYTSVDFEYYNLSNNSIKTFKLIGNNFSDNWRYFYSSFDSNDSFGVYELSKVTINSASGEKYIYERENNLSFVLGDLEFRNTSLLNNIRFQPSRVIAGESTLLSVEIVEDRDDIKCINFMPYQSEIETNNDCGIGGYGIMLSRVENTNIYQGIVNIPSNSTNGLYGIYKLVVYDNNNIPLEIVEPQEMYYEVYGGVEPDLLPPIVGDLTISQT
ncbi:MAG: hypothetical protein RBQ97_08905, partial [Acholeplasma sp.]|nr:hypothetical protein [Acholeplasma sp.]